MRGSDKQVMPCQTLEVGRAGKGLQRLEVEVEFDKQETLLCNVEGCLLGNTDLPASAGQTGFIPGHKTESTTLQRNMI